MADETKYDCPDCNWVGSIDDLVDKEHLSNDYDEEPYYTYHCPFCGCNHDDMKEIENDD